MTTGQDPKLAMLNGKHEEAERGDGLDRIAGHREAAVKNRFFSVILRFDAVRLTLCASAFGFFQWNPARSGFHPIAPVLHENS